MNEYERLKEVFRAGYQCGRIRHTTKSIEEHWFKYLLSLRKTKDSKNKCGTWPCMNANDGGCKCDTK